MTVYKKLLKPFCSVEQNGRQGYRINGKKLKTISSAKSVVDFEIIWIQWYSGERPRAIMAFLFNFSDRRSLKIEKIAAWGPYNSVYKYRNSLAGCNCLFFMVPSLMKFYCSVRSFILKLFKIFSLSMAHIFSIIRQSPENKNCNPLYYLQNYAPL